jgi:hypothetical protein
LKFLQGAVDYDLGRRSYSLEGSMILLPQCAPYAEPLGISICGGSTPNYHYALDNCVSTQPEVGNPVWTIERMVRVVSPLLLCVTNTTASPRGVLCHG